MCRKQFELSLIFVLHFSAALSQPIVTTVVGDGRSGQRDGQGTLATLDRPTGLKFDRTGNLIIVDTQNHKIRKMTPDGSVVTVAGTGTPGYSDGPALSAKFRLPKHLVLDTGGNMYVTDSGNNCVRKIDTSGVVSTIAGSGDAVSVGGQSTQSAPAGSAAMR